RRPSDGHRPASGLHVEGHVRARLSVRERRQRYRAAARWLPRRRQGFPRSLPQRLSRDADARMAVSFFGDRAFEQGDAMTLQVRPLDAPFGAEIIGADFSRDMHASTVAEIEAAWYRPSIPLFRRVEMTPAQHVAFPRRLGPLHIMEPLEFNLAGYPEVLVVSN